MQATDNNGMRTVEQEQQKSESIAYLEFARILIAAEERQNREQQVEDEEGPDE